MVDYSYLAIIFDQSQLENSILENQTITQLFYALQNIKHPDWNITNNHGFKTIIIHKYTLQEFK